LRKPSGGLGRGTPLLLQLFFIYYVLPYAGIVLTEGLTKLLMNVYRGWIGEKAVRDVSIELRPGRIHALLGENGAGKSTLMRIVATLQAAVGGRLLTMAQAVPWSSSVIACRQLRL